MKKERLSASILGEKDERLIGSFYDGELAEVEERGVERRLRSDASFEAHLHELRSISDGVKAWVAESYDSGRRTPDVWSAIAVEAGRIAADRRLKKERIERILAVLQAPTVFLMRLMQPSALAAAGFACLLFIAVSIFSSQPTRVAGRQEPGQAAPRVIAASHLEQRHEQPFFVAFGGEIREGEPESAPPYLDVSQLINSDNHPRTRLSNARVRLPEPEEQQAQFKGLRTGGVDIMWMKTEDALKIVPVKDRSAPPVLWIARSSK